MKTMIDHGLVVTMDGDAIYEDGCVLIDGSTISYVGSKPDTAEYDRYIDARGGIVMPGLINTHTHSPMTLLKGIGNDCVLSEWLHDYIFPLEEKLDGEAVYYGTLLACAEMIKSGTTAFCDMYFLSENSAKAVLSAGMKANLSYCVTGKHNDYKKRLSDARDLFRNYNGAGDGLLKIEHSVHSVYTCSKEAIRAVAEVAQLDNTGIQIHLSETMKENRDCYGQYGKSPTEVMLDCGVFNVRVNAAHCVYLSENDMDILKNYGASVAHNPTSNLKLASGVANVKELLEKEVNVSLGTDGSASNNSLDMFAEMKLCGLLHKGMRLDPKLIPAETALSMATVNGAKTLGRQNETGVLKAGFKADIIILDADAPALVPINEPLSTLVYGGCGGHVVTSLINGQLVMEDRELKTIDMEEVKPGIMQVRKRL